MTANQDPIAAFATASTLDRRSLEPEGPPIVTAQYDSDCSGCGARIQEGDSIQADTFGGWYGECCLERA